MSAFASEFIPIGDLPGGGISSNARGVSDDGRVVVGNSKSTESGFNSNDSEAYVWTEEAGIVGLGYLGNGEFFSSIGHGGSGISGDGKVIVGRSGRAGDGDEAFRWTSNNGMIGLGRTREGLQTHSKSTSEDGSVVVGGTLWSDRAWYWTEDEGIVNLSNTKATAYDVSADGRVIVGTADPTERFRNYAFRWTREDRMQRLTPPADLEDPISVALSVSADGSAIVGSVRELNKNNEPFLWTAADGMRPLGRLTDQTTNAYGVSNSGEIVIGGGNGAFIWNDNLGILDLKTVLVDEYGLGDSLEGWELSEAWDISPNGRFIVGGGTNPQGSQEGWLARLDYAFLGSPIIGDFNDDKVVDALDLDVLGIAIRENSEDLSFDLDESGDLAKGDIRMMVETVLGTWIGDSNLNGEFNSRDLVNVFQAGEYEDSLDGNSTWSTGDWNLDGDFTSNDIVFAFQDGGYEQGFRNAPIPVPEPASVISMLIALLILSRQRAGTR